MCDQECAGLKASCFLLQAADGKVADVSLMNKGWSIFWGIFMICFGCPFLLVGIGTCFCFNCDLILIMHQWIQQWKQLWTQITLRKQLWMRPARRQTPDHVEETTVDATRASTKPDYIVTCAATEDIVKCTNMAGDQLVTFGTPQELLPKQNPYGPWLVERVHGSLQTSDRRLCLATPSGEIFWHEPELPESSAAHPRAAWTACGICAGTGKAALGLPCQFCRGEGTTQVMEIMDKV